MVLIKKLPTEIINKRCVYFGLFYCVYCEKDVKLRLSNGLTNKSCGCMRNTLLASSHLKHGDRKTRLYNTLQGMKQRCFNFKNKDYYNYGGRGIKVCPEWTDKENGYINFRNWALNNGYKEELTIDRINNNGNYEPINSRWVTRTENSRNTRTTKLSMKKAEEIRELHQTSKFTQQELAILNNVSISTISETINKKRWTL